MKYVQLVEIMSLIERDAQQQRQLKRIEPRLSALAQKIKQRQQEVSA